MLQTVSTAKHAWEDSANILTDAPSVAHLVTTRSTRILHADVAAASLLQRGAHVLEQEPLAALVEREECRELRSRLLDLADGDAISDWPLRFRVPSGEAIDVVATVRATLDEGSSEPFVYRWTLCAAPCDASPRNENEAMANPPTMESELRQLAHELNQPLAAIVMYARGIQLRLKAGALSDADLRDALDVVVKQALRATEIVRALDRKWGS